MLIRPKNKKTFKLRVFAIIYMLSSKVLKQKVLVVDKYTQGYTMTTHGGKIKQEKQQYGTNRKQNNQFFIFNFPIDIYEFALIQIQQYLINNISTKRMNQPNNSHQIVRSAINVFILIAIGISLFQQLSFSSNKNQTIIEGQSTPQIAEPVGPIIPGIMFKVTDNFNKPIKQFLVKNEINIQVGSYQFKGNQYWFNIVLNWGHLALVYILIGKYKSETNESTKKKIAIGGAIAVFAWFFIANNLKLQRVSVQISGVNVYEKDFIDQTEINDILIQHQFNDDAIVAETVPKNNDQVQKENQFKQTPKVEIVQDEIIQEEIF